MRAVSPECERGADLGRDREGHEDRGREPGADTSREIVGQYGCDGEEDVPAGETKSANHEDRIRSLEREHFSEPLSGWSSYSLAPPV